MSFFEAFSKIKESNLASGAVQKLSAHLRAYITEHYYLCTPQTLKGLGAMYAAGGEFTQNIDKTGGYGTALLRQRLWRFTTNKRLESPSVSENRK